MSKKKIMEFCVSYAETINKMTRKGVGLIEISKLLLEFPENIPEIEYCRSLPEGCALPRGCKRKIDNGWRKVADRERSLMGVNSKEKIASL